MEPKPKPSVERRSLRDATAHHYFIPATYTAYRLLRFVFVAAPIVAGLDKFFRVLVNWDVYLSPLVPALFGIAPRTFMIGVGVVEIAAGLLVAVKPRIGGIVVGAWLLGIVANLLTVPGFYDIALRDLGLAFSAFALSLLSVEFEHYRRRR